MKRRTVLTSFPIIASGIVGAGCLGRADEESEGTSTPEQTPTPEHEQTPTPTPEYDVSDDEAKRQAYEAETEHVTEIVESSDCVSGGVGVGYPHTEFTSIEDRTEDGVYVSVDHPYWYTTDEGTHVHTGSQATYLVTTETAERIEGSEIADPCVD